MSDTSPRPALDPAHLAVYAHELRGALTVIAGYTELLRHDLSPAEKTAALDGIERAVRRADGLCGDALAGRAPVPAAHAARERVGVGALVGDVVAEQHAATGRDVVARVSPEAENAVVSADRDALTRVIANLIGNAAKYSLARSAIEVDARVEGAFAVIEVADRGPGIPEAEQARVFEPFERLERDAEAPGHGLGLTVVRSVTDAHDGHVSIHDRPGGGTVVRLELPLA